MKPILFLLILFLSGCTDAGNKDSVYDKMTGNWFILYPEENLNNEEQRKIYAAIQDSLVNEKGLKAVTLLENGQFIQWDSTILYGKWGVIDEKQVVISGGGKGFTNFKTSFAAGKKDIALLTEHINTSGERIELVWHLKKITEGKAETLFLPEKNNWRIRPAAAETEAAMKKRLSEMLHYYAVYFKLISEESSYFMPMRVMLPLRFYQHAIGMREFDEHHRFVSMYASVEEAKKAYGILKETVNSSGNNYPDTKADSFSLEYSQMLEHLAEEILR